MLVIGTKAAAQPRMTKKINDGIPSLRMTGAVLVHKWRSKPKGTVLRWHLLEIERLLTERPIDALIEFLVRMQFVSDSVELRAVLAAAEAMMKVPPRFDLTRNPPPPQDRGGYFHIGPGLEMTELTADEAAEIAALGPAHSTGDDCEICTVLARQRRDREARASSSSI